MDRSDHLSSILTIAAVERDVGLTKDTLRAWERRYGFPAPLRDAHGERLYPGDQVEKLKLLRRLVDRGLRPGKIAQLSLAELLRLNTTAANTQPPASDHSIDPEHSQRVVALLQLLQRYGPARFSQQLSTELLRLGLGKFVTEIAAPLTVAVGESWARSELAIFEEHLFSERLTTVLRSALHAIPTITVGAEVRPRVLMTTLPLELHTLGLLMAEVMLTLAGARCTSLGAQTPVDEIASAARVQHTDIVALSFSPLMPRNQVSRNLAELRNLLAPEVEIWVGGSNPGLQRRLPNGIFRIVGLDQIAPAVAAWRTRSLEH